MNKLESWVSEKELQQETCVGALDPDVFLVFYTQQWQTKVLDALAAWLEDDTHQIETTLVVEENVLLLVAILQDYRQKTNEVSRVLEPILRMLERSDKLSRSMGQNGLAPVIVDMLRWADAATCLMLLRALRRIYAMHLKPKVMYL